MAARIAICQMRSTNVLEVNLQSCAQLIKRAAELGAEMAFFPENFSFLGSSSAESLSIAQPLTGPRMQEFQELAKQHQIWLSLGGFQEKHDSPNHLCNTHVIVDKDGQLRASYRKMHLFDVNIEGGPKLMESSFAVPGNRYVTCDSPVGKLGLSVCYDLRFPELYQILTAVGAQVLLVPAAFTVPTGKAHWHTLLRARAIETQCFVIASAQVGQHNEKRSSFGHALVIDPWGEVLIDCGETENDVQLVELDLARLAKVRREMPVQAHRERGFGSFANRVQLVSGPSEGCGVGCEEYELV
eukprot:c8529_g1_i1.p1 GENE.c8529_g1_i1~~c8529_g1_i1.p1  ORF type:complete len:318 (+),score=57.61 c8529_g1_i1:58-954(+)